MAVTECREEEHEPAFCCSSHNRCIVAWLRTFRSHGVPELTRLESHVSDAHHSGE